MDGLRRSVIEAASWRLATELCRRHPNRLRTYITYPAGGTYDCLSLSVGGAKPRPLIQLNRVGTIQVHETFAGDVLRDIRAQAWSTYLSAEPYRFLRDLEDEAGLPPPTSTPATVAHTLTYRLLAALVGVQTLGVRDRYIVSGYTDSSGYDGGVREELFAAMPLADRRRTEHHADDPFGIPEYRFWFVIDRGHLVACLDTTGWACDTNGTVYDLPALYDRDGRRVGVTLSTAFPTLSD